MQCSRAIPNSIKVNCLPRTFVPRACKIRQMVDFSLYLVANRPSYPDEQLFFSKIMSAVKGGVSCIQLRDHRGDRGSIIRTAKRLKDIVKDIPLFINTPEPLYVARAVEAAGVFLEDFNPAHVKAIKEADMIVGVAVWTMWDVLNTAKISADYISVKVANSKSCPRNDRLWGIKGLEWIRKISPHRIVAVGGLGAKSSEEVYKVLSSTDGIAMAGGLMDVDNPCSVAQEIQIIRNKFIK